jgi:beta-xylosidase
MTRGNRVPVGPGAGPAWRRRTLLTAVVGVVLGTVVVARLVADAGSHRGRPLARYTNPVAARDFPDPSIVASESGFTAVATGVAGINVPTLSSRDLDRWRERGDALPVPPPWAEPDWRSIWAPALDHAGDEWVLWFTARDRHSGRQCIGYAVASRSTGPFESDATKPSVCQTEEGGSIDPFVFTAHGRRWLLWKSDGNCCGLAAKLWSQPLDQQGRRLRGSPRLLLSDPGGWTVAARAGRSTIENPAMLRSGATYHLLFSGNDFESDTYATGHARCESPVGPCLVASSRPVLESRGAVAGPGGASVFDGRHGRVWLAYHAWQRPLVGYEAGGVRSLRVDPVDVLRGRVHVRGPSSVTRTVH